MRVPSLITSSARGLDRYSLWNTTCTRLENQRINLSRSFLHSPWSPLQLHALFNCWQMELRNDLAMRGLLPSFRRTNRRMRCRGHFVSPWPLILSSYVALVSARTPRHVERLIERLACTVYVAVRRASPFVFVAALHIAAGPLALLLAVGAAAPTAFITCCILLWYTHQALKAFLRLALPFVAVALLNAAARVLVASTVAALAAVAALLLYSACVAALVLLAHVSLELLRSVAYSPVGRTAIALADTATTYLHSAFSAARSAALTLLALSRRRTSASGEGAAPAAPPKRRLWTAVGKFTFQLLHQLTRAGAPIWYLAAVHVAEAGGGASFTVLSFIGTIFLVAAIDVRLYLAHANDKRREICKMLHVNVRLLVMKPAQRVILVSALTPPWLSVPTLILCPLQLTLTLLLIAIAIAHLLPRCLSLLSPIAPPAQTPPQRTAPSTSCRRRHHRNDAAADEANKNKNLTTSTLPSLLPPTTQADNASNNDATRSQCAMTISCCTAPRGLILLLLLLSINAAALLNPGERSDFTTSTQNIRSLLRRPLEAGNLTRQRLRTVSSSGQINEVQSDVIVLTETKLTGEQQQRKWCRKLRCDGRYTTYFSNVIGRSGKDKSKRGPRGGVAMIVVNEFAERATRIELPNSKGYAIRLDFDLPAGVKITLLGIYMPQDLEDKQLADNIRKYILECNDDCVRNGRRFLLEGDFNSALHVADRPGPTS